MLWHISQRPRATPAGAISQVPENQSSAIIRGAVVGGVVLGMAGLLAGSVFDNLVNDHGGWNFGVHTSVGAASGMVLGAGLGALLGWSVSKSTDRDGK